MSGRLLLFCLAAALLAGASPGMGAQFAIDWAVLSGGGGEMSSASYRMNGSLGQSVTGYASSSSYQHWIGFWVEPSATLPPNPVIVNTLDEAKKLVDGTVVQADGVIATTSSGAFGSTLLAYVEEPDRASGIRVALAAPAPWLTEGSRVSVTGTMDTTANDERQIASATLTPGIGSLLLDPLHMTNKTLGGDAIGAPPAGQYGVTGGSGANTIGLLAVVWGTVINDPTVGYTLIDDGSGTPVRVETGHLAVLWSSGDYLSVTGLSSLYKSGGTRQRVIIPRSNSDVAGF